MIIKRPPLGEYYFRSDAAWGTTDILARAKGHIIKRIEIFIIPGVFVLIFFADSTQAAEFEENLYEQNTQVRFFLLCCLCTKYF